MRTKGAVLSRLLSRMADRLQSSRSLGDSGSRATTHFQNSSKCSDRRQVSRLRTWLRVLPKTMRERRKFANDQSARHRHRQRLRQAGNLPGSRPNHACTRTQRNFTSEDGRPGRSLTREEHKSHSDERTCKHVCWASRSSLGSFQKLVQCFLVGNYCRHHMI